MTRRTALAMVICASAGYVFGAQAGPGTDLLAAERVWQKGIWRSESVERPRVLFTTQTRDPNSTLPRTAPARETRTYVIDTDTMSLELRQDATVDTPRIEVLIGLPVTFALEKKTVYVKDAEGKEHKLSVRKQTPLAAAQTK